MSFEIELRDEEQQKTYTILVGEKDYHEIVVKGNLALATELLRKQQEKENFNKAFEIIHAQENFECFNVPASTSKSSLDNHMEAPVDDNSEDNSDTQQLYATNGNNELYISEIEEPLEESTVPTQENNKNWTHEAILMLIHLCQKYEKEFESGVKKYVWNKVARELSERFKLDYSIQQCDTKWKGLKNTYKAVKKHNEQSGNHKKNWKYFDLLNEILFARPEIQAPATCSSRSGLHVLGKRINNMEEETPNATNPQSQNVNNNENLINNTPPSTSGYQSTFMKKRKAAENAVERRHKEKMAKQDRYLDLLERLTTAIERTAPVSQNDVA